MSSEGERKPSLKLVGGQEFSLDGGKTILGRGKECQVVLSDYRVSKHHAEIRPDPLGFLIEDDSSLNRTYVNGVLLPHKTPRRLLDGDRIKICDFTLAFRAPGPLNSPITLESDDESSSKILGSITMAGSSVFGPKMKAEDKLQAVLEISRDIGASLQLRDVLDRTLISLFRIFPQADRGFVLMKGPSGTPLVPLAVRSRKDDGGPRSLSNTIFSHVMEQGQAILSTNLSSDSRFKDSESISGAEIRTMMCAP